MTVHHAADSGHPWLTVTEVFRDPSQGCAHRVDRLCEPCLATARSEWEGMRLKATIDLLFTMATLAPGPIACYLCGVHLDSCSYTVDHIVPLARGGTNAVTNLAIACQSCNARKGAR